MDLDLAYPALSDLRARCRRRIPHFAWEYLDSGTGAETARALNRTALDAVRLRPAVLRGRPEPDLATSILGFDCALPVGIAPIGMSGLIWPGAEAALARLGAAERLPYCLSTVATREPEEIGPLAGDMGWFQLYPPRDMVILRDMLARARAAGFRALILTADVPGTSRRERQRRADLAIPPKTTLRMLAQVAARPAWAMGTLRTGVPRLRLMEGYHKAAANTGSTEHVGYLLRTAPDWDYLDALRRAWDGPLLLKGVMEPEVATRAVAAGVDAIWVSNHAGRQFDGAPAALAVLPGIRAALGAQVPVIFDGGVEGGLDVLRALALGADFVMLGRAWHYALGAFGARGAAHLAHVLREDLISCMAQMGIARPEEARGQLIA